MTIEYFRITYQVPLYKLDDPDDPVYDQYDCKFEGGEVTVTGPGAKPYKTYISARLWAEDLAYSLADKGWYEIEEISEKQYRGRD